MKDNGDADEDRDDDLESPELSEMPLETLSGDVRDAMLMRVRDIKRPWSMLTEAEQYDLANGLELAAKEFVRNAVQMLTDFEYPRAVVKLVDVKIIGGDSAKIDAKVTCSNIHQNRDVLGEHVGQMVALMAIDSTEFMGEREPVKIDPDQPELPTGEDAEGDDSEEPEGEGGGDQTGDEPEGQPDEFEAKVAKAETFIRAEETPTATYLQGKFAIGRAEAERLIAELVSRGVLSEKDKAGKRSILPPKGKGDAPEGDAA
ncbi:MAG: DNA translocase FtsK [Pseudooceanicola atlanticus]